MNEFEWLKQTRALKRPVTPRHDLWPGIAQRIHATARLQPTRGQRALPWAMAASLAAVSVLAGWIAWHAPALAPPQVVVARAIPAQVAQWKPSDPRLVGAAIELNIARRQLTLAIGAAPGDAFLQRMLEHTNQQIDRLQQLEHRAG